MKQLTIEPPNEKDGQATSSLQLAMPVHPVHRGVAVPQHMVAPGQEGYRTPTVEDYERAHRESTQHDHSADCPSTSHSHTHLNGQRPGLFGNVSFSLSNLDLSPRILRKLEWRERIRHFTWVGAV